MYELEYLFILTDTNSPVFKSLSELLKFFKSYTVDMTSFNILYLFDSRYYNMIKLISDIKSVKVHIDYDEKTHTSHSDIIERFSSYFSVKDNENKMYDKYFIYTEFGKIDRLDLDDKLLFMKGKMYPKEKINIYDDVFVNTSFMKKDDFNIRDSLRMFYD
jgi:hypothetical protein